MLYYLHIKCTSYILLSWAAPPRAVNFPDSALGAVPDNAESATKLNYTNILGQNIIELINNNMNIFKNIKNILSILKWYSITIK